MRFRSRSRRRRRRRQTETGRRAGRTRAAARVGQVPRKHRRGNGGHGHNGSNTNGSNGRHHSTSPTSASHGGTTPTGSGGSRDHDARPRAVVSSPSAAGPDPQRDPAKPRSAADASPESCSRRPHPGAQAPVVTGQLVSDVTPLAGRREPARARRGGRRSRPLRRRARRSSGSPLGPIVGAGSRLSLCSRSAHAGSCAASAIGGHCASAAERPTAALTDAFARRHHHPQHRPGDLPRRQRAAGAGSDRGAAGARGRLVRARRLLGRAARPASSRVFEALGERRAGASGVAGRRPCRRRCRARSCGQEPGDAADARVHRQARPHRWR